MPTSLQHTDTSHEYQLYNVEDKNISYLPRLSFLPAKNTLNEKETKRKKFTSTKITSDFVPSIPHHLSGENIVKTSTFLLLLLRTARLSSIYQRIISYSWNLVGSQSESSCRSYRIFGARSHFAPPNRWISRAPFSPDIRMGREWRRKKKKKEKREEKKNNNRTIMERAWWRCRRRRRRTTTTATATTTTTTTRGVFLARHTHVVGASAAATAELRGCLPRWGVWNVSSTPPPFLFCIGPARRRRHTPPSYSDLQRRSISSRSAPPPLPLDPCSRCSRGYTSICRIRGPPPPPLTRKERNSSSLPRPPSK